MRSNKKNKPKSWAQIVGKGKGKSENIKTDVSIISSKRGRTPVKIKVNIEIKPNVIKRIYPDLLITFIDFMDESTYVNFASSYDKFENMSFLNGPFLKYLEVFHPEEYEKVIEDKDMIIKTHRKIKRNDPYLFYELHKIIYSLYYDDVEYSKEELDDIKYNKNLEETGDY